ncbi:MAG: transglycosylase SLT domain-containing protein [Bacteroidales bacterium]|nr:transglycosylase SLT domain-containing protein [Bacteroidales bacterium]
MKRIKAFLLFSLAASLTAPAFAQSDSNEITVRDERNASDQVIDLPEAMTYNLDSLLSAWHAKEYLTPDTTCIDPDHNPTFTPEVYQERLSRIPAIMEMPYNNIVQQFIDQYSGRLRRSVAYMLGAGNFYIPIFEEALDYYGLPLELKYLPVIESALDPTAVSKAGAVGLWQFMLATGKSYDLEVNSLVDERRDPIKSSWAAAKYLRDLYNIYGDWNLVIAAYNCGPTNISKAIARADGARDYWTIYPYLPKETRGYVPAFIAANYIMNYYCEHNICPMKTKMPVTTDTVMVARNLHMDQIAALCGVDKEIIHALNPQYRTDVIPGQSKPCALRLPHDKILAFITLKDSVYNYRAEELLTRRNTVAVVEKAAEPKRTTTSSRSSSSSRKTVTVRSGDTLSAIAKRNRTTVSRIKRLNGMKSDRINPGQKLRVR